MEPLALVATAFALAIDAFAVSAAVAASLPEVSRRHAFRLSWHFGLFQALMPAIGWLAGRSAAGFLQSVDHWIAFGLLAFLGVRMILAREEDQAFSALRDPTRGWSLLGLSVATSIDALAVGLSLGLMGTPVVFSAAVIGVVAALMTLAGVGLGRRVGAAFRRHAARVGGVVLLLIGIRILLDHLLA